MDKRPIDGPLDGSESITGLFVPEDAIQIQAYRECLDEGHIELTFFYRMSEDSPKRRVDVCIKYADQLATEPTTLL